MKCAAFILFIALTFIGCNKDKVPNLSDAMNYYQSTGNVLILVVGDTLVATYEYNLPTIQLINDSLPIIYETFPDPNSWHPYYYWKFLPNTDTLFWTTHGSHQFMEDQINNHELLSLNAPVIFDINHFQFIQTSSTIDLQEIWEIVACLDIVKTYREASPTSKIGVSRQVLYIYDEELNFSVPQEKFLIILVKD
jgi:hypothetical protein